MITITIDENTKLTTLHEKDAQTIFQLLDRSRGYLRNWLPFVDRVQSTEDIESFIELSQKQYEGNNGFQAAIWYRGEIAGIIGYHKVDWANRSTSIGYWLGESYQGRGLMTKACWALVEYAFAELNVNRVEIRCATENAASRAIPKRLGFTIEGCIRQSEWLYDHYVDHVVYGMLASEWTK